MLMAAIRVRERRQVRASWALVLLVGAAGCTEYQPVSWNGKGSWAEARFAAERSGRSSRSIAGSDVKAGGGGRHLVLPGETLSEVAEHYRTPLATLANLNDVAPPYRVYAGQVLDIPSVTLQASPASADTKPRTASIVARELPAPEARPQPVQVASMAVDGVALAVRPVETGSRRALAPTPMPRRAVEATRLAAQKSPPPLSGDGFLWPVQGSITSPFGAKPSGARNDGINIRATEGTPVRAAENGVVVYAGDEIPGYGRMLLISHADGLTTAYAHNAKLLVAVGAVVERGQTVATVGRTGDVTSPQLHFELRDGKEPLDPLAYLAPAATRVASRL
jgi:murein DD-endopeptidase MepM/ murein hydrolase activator NlpD